MNKHGSKDNRVSTQWKFRPSLNNWLCDSGQVPWVLCISFLIYKMEVVATLQVCGEVLTSWQVSRVQPHSWCVPRAQHPLPSPAPSYCVFYSARAVPCPQDALWSCLLASRTEASFQRNVACPATSIVRWAKSIFSTASPHRPTAWLPFSNLHTMFWESSMPASTPELHQSFTSYSACAQFFTDITMSCCWWRRWGWW